MGLVAAKPGILVFCTPVRGGSVRDAVAAQHAQGREAQDTRIAPERLVLQIPRIQRHFLRYGQLIAAIDLRPAGQAGAQGVDVGLGAQCDQVVLVVQRRARADPAHFAAQNVPELRQFIQAAAAQKTADGGEPLFGALQQMRGHFGRVDAHAAELGHAKQHVVAPDAV